MKLNKKGFMMVEVVVVSAIILGVLISIYTSYSKVFRRYSEVLDYNNVDGIYKLASIRDELITTSAMFNLNTILYQLMNDNIPFYRPTTGSNNYYILKSRTISNLLDVLKNNNISVTEGFKDYIEYLSNSVNFTSKYVMILVYPKDSNSDSNYYSYLELEA